MPKAKLMNELIKHRTELFNDPKNEDYKIFFMGFLQASEIILSKEQLDITFNEAKKRSRFI
jgi:hypothetical protein